MLFFGVVPAYKAGAYLRPNAGGTGPLVEAIGPPRMRFLSWVGTSMFFIDAVLTIIISSISASDVTLLIFPELAPWRIVLAEVYAFFIMAVLSAIGPRRAVPLFLVGGGAFTIFTIFALSWVALQAAAQPQLADAVPAIVSGLESSGVVTHVVEASGEVSSLSAALFFQFFLRSMSSAMLGFSGYEVIPASGKHAARPKWKVINTALIVAALFLICTGIIQLFAASTWPHSGDGRLQYAADSVRACFRQGHVAAVDRRCPAGVHPVAGRKVVAMWVARQWPPMPRVWGACHALSKMTASAWWSSGPSPPC